MAYVSRFGRAILRHHRHHLLTTNKLFTPYCFVLSQNLATPAAAAGSGSSSGNHEWVDAVSEGIKQMGSRAYEFSTSAHPTLQHWLNSPSTQALIPATVSLGSCAAVWLLLPRLLRRFHSYMENPTARVPYKMSIWSTLEDPTRLFVTAVAFSQLAAVVAPSTMAGHYVEQIWRGGLVVTILWFLHRWKSLAFSKTLIDKATTKEEKDRYLALDKMSSVGIIILGTMALAEASGVAVQSFLTVGGIGGIATAFAARDILGNVLTGLILQFIKPFSVGDLISAGSVEGQVIKMGLHSTSLLNSDKYPVIVPNSFFSSQVIINKSLAQKRAVRSKLYARLQDISLVPQVTREMVDALKSHPKVDQQLTLTYDLVELKMKQESLDVEQQILVQFSNLLHKCGISLPVC